MLDQSVHGYWSICPSIYGVKTSVQIFDFCEVNLSQCLGAWSSLQGDLSLRVNSSPSISRVRLNYWDSEKEELLSRWGLGLGDRCRVFPARPVLWLSFESSSSDRRDRWIFRTGGAAEGGGLAAARCCIRKALFPFMIFICSAIPCISRWSLTRSGTWLVLAIR